MAGRGNLGNQLRIFVGDPAKDEKGRLDVVCRQELEQALRVGYDATRDGIPG